MKKLASLLAALALLSSGAAAQLAQDVSDVGAAVRESVARQRVLSAGQARTMRSEQDAARSIVQSVAPSVVTIVVKTRTKTTRETSEATGDGGGQGSGFVVDAAQGLIMTNAHVVASVGRNGWAKTLKGQTAQVLRASVKVTLADGQTLAAEVLDYNDAEDLALVRVDPALAAGGLTAATLGDETTLKEGDFVIAFGSPLGLSDTKTFGRVSKLDRTGYYGRALIQHDAAVNHGNSGGPLVDLDGSVVGVNEAIVATADQSAGLSLAIPVSRVKAMLQRYAADGRLHDADTGLEVSKFRYGGLVIDQIQAGSPAARSNQLFEGDIIVAIDGQNVYGGSGRDSAADPLDAFHAAVAARKPGDVVRLTILRGGMLNNFKVAVDVTLY